MQPYNHHDLFRLARHRHNVGGTPHPAQYLEEALDSGVAHIHTALYDTLFTPLTGETRLIHNGIPNLIVIGFGLIVAALLKGGEATGEPIQYWAVGEGEGAAWDSLSGPDRQAKSTFALTELYDEIARVTTVNVFIDENDEEILTPTSRLEIQAFFGPTVEGDLREFGLFAGEATSTLGSGTLIDHKSHSVISMESDGGSAQVLIRSLRLNL